MINCCYLQSPIGVLKLEARNGCITGLEICRKGESTETTVIPEAVVTVSAVPAKETEGVGAEAEKKLCPVLVQAVTELTEYFAGTRKCFNVPVYLEGTAFQLQIWQKLKEIPYGETRNYGQIALAAGNPKAARAVGMANNRNPVMIIIPCHRVIGKDGGLVGFGGGLEAKKYLLDLEAEVLSGKKI